MIFKIKHKDNRDKFHNRKLLNTDYNDYYKLSYAGDGMYEVYKMEENDTLHLVNGQCEAQLLFDIYAGERTGYKFVEE